MKQKTIVKIMIDAIMLILFVAMLFSNQTGMVFHEVFGMVLGGLVLAHVLLNLQWFRGVTHQWSSRSVKTKVQFSMDIALIVLTFAIMVSGVLISTVLFPNISVSNRFLFVMIHKWGSYAAMAVIAGHLVMHARYLASVLPRMFRSSSAKPVRRIASATIAIVFIAALVYTQISPALASASQAAITAETTVTPTAETTVEPTSPSTTIDAGSSSSTGQKEQTTEPTTPTVEQATPAQSLSSYLSGLHCTGCGKHCPLSAPQCGRGEAQAQEATQEYNTTYGTSAQ